MYYIRFIIKSLKTIIWVPNSCEIHVYFICALRSFYVGLEKFIKKWG
jgi:hypothetical protein